MRKFTFAIALSLAFTVNLTVFAQKLTKEQKKEAKQLKSQMKSMDPFEFKKMLEENSSLKGEVSGLNDRVANLQQQISTKDAEIQNLSNQLDEAKKNAPEIGEIDASKKVSSKGVVFKVQIGAFRNKDLTKYFENNPNFSGEVDPDGTKKYTLGYFRDYWEADTFKKYLREMGVKDAWIVPYKDGQRVNIKDVLEDQTKPAEGA